MGSGVGGKWGCEAAHLGGGGGGGGGRGNCAQIKVRNNGLELVKHGAN